MNAPDEPPSPRERARLSLEVEMLRQMSKAERRYFASVKADYLDAIEAAETEDQRHWITHKYWKAYRHSRKRKAVRK